MMKHGDLKKCAVNSRRIWIGFSADGSEIVATYTTQTEVNSFKTTQQSVGEIVTGPWVREPRSVAARRRRVRRGRRA